MCTDARLVSDEMLRTLKAVWRGDSNGGKKSKWATEEQQQMII